MAEQADVIYTKMSNGDWIIESTTQLPISIIQSTMQFVDSSGNKHEVVKATTPDESPKAPYYYVVKVSVKK